MNGAENDTVLVSLIEDANRDPRMKSLYLDYLDTLATERVDDFNQFIYTGGWSKWGSWGALEYQDQPMQDAPKYAALVEWEQLRLTVDRDTISINGGTAVAFSLSGGPLRAGRGYQVLATSSGRFPGTILPSAQILPLNTDDFSNTVRDMTNQGPFRDFMGTFDSSGKAVATLNLGPSRWAEFMTQSPEAPKGRQVPRWKYVLALSIAALIIVLVVQNAEAVQIRLLFWDFEMPRAVLIVAVLGAGFLLGSMWQARRLRRRR